jgi:hypothetical protein
MRNEEQEIFDAGQKYQTILDKMKLQRTEYARFVSHVGSLESRVLNGDMESAINLPVMPQLKEFTLQVAENLLSLAESKVQRKGRIAPPIDRENLGSYRLAQLGHDEFSPERFSKEINQALFSNEGLNQQKTAVRTIIEKTIGKSLESGVTSKLTGVQSNIRNAHRMLDGISSLRVYELISAIATRMEMSGIEDHPLENIDRWLHQVDQQGRAVIPKGLCIGHGDCTLSLSIRNSNLFIKPSKYILDILTSESC